MEDYKENVNPHPSVGKISAPLSPMKGVLIDITHKINAQIEDMKSGEELLEDHESNFLQARVDCKINLQSRFLTLYTG